jgi:hypothetical protein
VRDLGDEDSCGVSKRCKHWWDPFSNVVIEGIIRPGGTPP